ncbi:MAG: hypothetical protein RL522_540 [Pseudomonadota bacterium]|jgi:predicted transcriptional regulator
MTTSTLRLDDALRARIAHVARATEQTPHSFMVQALAEKVDEAEWKLGIQQEALRRDQALVAGEPAVEWHEMKSWLQQRLDTCNKKSPAAKRRK